MANIKKYVTDQVTAKASNAANMIPVIANNLVCIECLNDAAIADVVAALVSVTGVAEADWTTQIPQLQQLSNVVL